MRFSINARKTNSLILYCTLFIACNEKNAPPDSTNSSTCSHTPSTRSARNIGFDILDVTESASFEDNFIKADELKIDFIQILQPWNQYETSAGIYDGTAVDNLLILSDYA